MAFDPSLNGLTLTAGGPLSVGKPVTLLDANSMTLTDSHAFTLAKPLTVDWSGTLNLDGVLSDGVTSGSLFKTGVGTLALSGANSYTGGTTLLGGTLRALNDSAIGTGPLTVNSQAGSSTLDLGNGVNLGNSISLKTGLIVNNNAGTTSQLSGLISESGGTFGINKTGTGTLILSGANTFSGGVYVSNDSTIRLLRTTPALGSGSCHRLRCADTGLLANGINVGNQIHLGNNFTANVDTGTATLSGVIDEVTSSHLTKTGAGTLVLSGLNAYTGGSTISQGTLQGSSNSLFGEHDEQWNRRLRVKRRMDIMTGTLLAQET